MDNIKVLLVDDDPGFLDSCSMLLSPEFDVEAAENAEQAISILEEAEGAFDVAVIDMLMDGDEEAGLKLIQQIGQKPILVRPASIVLTAYGSIGNASKCMEAGARSYVEKGQSDTPEVLRQSIKRAAEFRRTLYFDLPPMISRALVDIIEERDPFESKHSIRVTDWSIAVLERMGVATPQKKLNLKIASGLHNIGKTLLPEYISGKPGVRTPKERELFETHPEHGRYLVSKINIITQGALEGILHHHERWDGSGYPHRLKGNEIPLLARIIAVACEYDHAFSPRYNRALRNPQGAKDAILKLKEEGKLAPDIVDVFVAAHEAGEIAKEETERFADVKFSNAEKQMELRQFDRAKQSCDKAIAEISEEDEYFRAALCVAAGDLFLNTDDALYSTAVEYYAQAIKLRPAYAEAYYKRGLAYQKQSMWEQADAHYAIATAIVPSYLEAHLARGEVRYSGNFLNEAGLSFDRVLSLIGKDADIGIDADALQLKKLKALAYLGKGRIQARKGEKAQALGNYNSALELCEEKLKEEIEILKERIEHQKEILQGEENANRRRS